jgi:hypothetical protein
MGARGRVLLWLCVVCGSLMLVVTRACRQKVSGCGEIVSASRLMWNVMTMAVIILGSIIKTEADVEDSEVT